MVNAEANSMELSELKVRNKFLAKVYLWMAVALSVSGLVALFTAQNPIMIDALFVKTRGMGFIGLCVAEIVLVFWLSSSIRKISAAAATIGFVIYSIINGMTLSSVFIVYELSSIVVVFFISAAMFLVMSLVGAFTKSNLNSFGRYFSMAIIGVMIASAINLLLSFTGHQSTKLDWIISILSVLIFTGLTAFDTQKLVRASENADQQTEDVFHKAAVIGALELYLDFINIFLSLLRLFGKRK